MPGGVPRTGRLGRKGMVLRHRVPGGWPSVDQRDAGGLYLRKRQRGGRSRQNA